MFKKVFIISFFVFLFIYLKIPVSASYYDGWADSPATDSISYISFDEGKIPTGYKFSSISVVIRGANTYPRFFVSGPALCAGDYGYYSSCTSNIYPRRYQDIPSGSRLFSAYNLTDDVVHTDHSGSIWLLDTTKSYMITLSYSSPNTYLLSSSSPTHNFANSIALPYNSGSGPVAQYAYINPVSAFLRTNPITYGLPTPWHCVNDVCTFEYDPEPSGSVTSQTISIMDNAYEISMEGDFEVTGPNYIAQITFQPACTTDDGHISLNNDSVVVMFDANNPRTTTEKITESLYYGEDYSTTSSLYSFHGVKLPFVAGQNCTYIATVNITDYTDPFNPIPIKLDDEADPYTTVMGEFTPIGNTPNTPLVDYQPNEAFCDTFDISCYVSYGLTQVKNFFLDLYKRIFLNDYNIFDDAVPTVYDGLVATLQVKKPFAYMYNVLDLNLHSAMLSDGIPDMNISFGNNYGLEDITIDFPSSFDTVLNSIRNIFIIVLGTVEVFYFVKLARRVRG